MKLVTVIFYTRYPNGSERKVIKKKYRFLNIVIIVKKLIIILNNIIKIIFVKFI